MYSVEAPDVLALSNGPFGLQEEHTKNRGIMQFQ